jgi:protoheme IX farnesyltransferase
MSVVEPAAYSSGGGIPARETLAGVDGAESSLCQSLVSLFKLRIVVLLLLAAVGGLFLAAGGWPGFGRLLLLLFSGGVAAAGSSALNEYMERDVDALMVRTRHRRPLVTGAIARPAWVPYAGALMIAGPVLVVWPFNRSLAFFLLLGAAIYLAVYTAWLKPRTPLNIVIGGAAGSAAVLSGSAAAGNWHDPGALLLALLLFLWTPTHFWSLAITCREDYACSNVPMLPARVPPRTAAAWVLLHTAGTALAALALATRPALGLPYLVAVGPATLYLLFHSVRLVVAPGDERAHLLFVTSNLYLAIVLLVVCLGTLVQVKL